jgi:hypothetical protein
MELAPLIVISGLLLLAYFGRSELAGAVAGFPTVTALVTALSAERHGQNFVQNSTSSIELGLFGTAVFVATYRSCHRLSIVRGAVIALLTYIATIGGLWILKPPILLAEAGIVVNAVVLSSIESVRPSAGPEYRRVRSVFQVLGPFVVALAVVSRARQLGPELAGLLTPFPATIFPLLVFTRARNMDDLPRTIGGVSRGLIATMCFANTLSVAARYSAYDPWWLAMLAATVALCVITIIYKTSLRLRSHQNDSLSKVTSLPAGEPPSSE